jgi:hypothetical protein
MFWQFGAVSLLANDVNEHVTGYQLLGLKPLATRQGGTLAEFYSQLKPHLPSDWALRAGCELPALLPSAKHEAGLS